MNYYGSYTGNRKRKTVRRVIAVLVSVAVIFGATVLFGNYLKKKSENSGVQNSGGIGRDDIFAETESQIIIPPSDGGLGSSESVQGICVMLGTKNEQSASDNGEGGKDKTENGDTAPLFSLFEERLTEAAKNNMGVLIPLTGENGYLLYNSARASAASRVPENPYLPDMTELGTAVESAKSKGLRTSALIVSGIDITAAASGIDEAIAADSRIAADAAEAGFDEVIIGSLVSSPDEITGETSHVILRYLNQMTAAAGDAEVGLSLPPEIYDTATLSPQIELFVSRSVFLTMELTDENSTVEHLNYICENLAGTLSVYNMRIMLSPVDTEIGDKLTDKLKAVGHTNYLFTRVPDTANDAAEETGTDGNGDGQTTDSNED